jgi:anti-anti-sigma factor
MTDKTVRSNKSGAKIFLAPDFALVEENIASLDKEIKNCLDRNDLRLVIDFELVPYINSQGLEKLLEYHDQVRRKGGSMEIFNPNPLCNEILNITGITDYIDIYFNLENAGGASYEGRDLNN